LTTPALRDDRYPGGAYHGRDGLGDVPWLTPTDWTPDPRSAAELIVDTARHRDRVRLVCLGPLTNIALALRLAPELPSLVDGLLIMGGSVRAGGNETMAAEFNFAADPDAAHVVFEAGFSDIALVPIDACDDTRMSWDDHQQLQRLDSPLAGLVRALLAGWEEEMFAPNGVGIYDPTAWLLGRAPSIAHWESVYLDVDVGGGVARGASIADWRARSGRSANVRVASAVPRRAAFFDRLFELLGQSAVK
jgi:purine nucleosidase